MGTHKLREDKTCLNCGELVEKRFCSNCGQENKETKESFYYLFFHTIEDIVHYDSGFWKTIKYLLFYPGKLTTEYLSGRRKKYVVPVKLYIFISFLTFFILSLVPTFEAKDFINFTANSKNEKKDIPLDSIPKIQGYTSLKEYDSIQNSLPENKRANGIQRYVERRIIETSSHNSSKEFFEKFLHNIFKNIPKTLFIIMPVFAFIIWLFHNKKRWFYFEHGIFTIHYFSMMLLSFTILSIIDFILSYTKFTSTSSILGGILFLWWVFYFYRSHHILYKENKWISRLKSTLILSINFIIITAIWAFVLFYLALNVN